MVGPRIASGQGRQARTAAPLLALSLVLVHLSGTVGGYLHFALVEHERCPEHGDLIHADGGRDSALRAESAAARVDRATGGSSVQQGSGPSEESHDPCSLTTALRERVTEPKAGPSEQIDHLPSPALLPSGEEQVLAGRTGYLIAPKTSPPRA